MQIINININELHINPIQPEVRTASHNLSKLKQSIKKYGLLQPISITKEKVIVDGHRRAACFKELGEETIPCIMYNGELDNIGDADGEDTRDIDLFIQTNGENKMSLNNLFYVDAFLKGGNIPNSVLKTMLFVVDKIDRKFLKYLLKVRVSPIAIRKLFIRYNHYSLKGQVDFGFFCKWIIENSALRLFRCGKMESQFEPQRQKVLNKIKDDFRVGKISHVDWIEL